MGIRYNKEFVPKDRRIVTSGPRDRQLKHAMEMAGSPQNNSGLVHELRSQIEKLNKQLEDKPKFTEGYTAEQVDEEIIKAIKVETANMKVKQEVEVNALQNQIENIHKEIEVSKEMYKKEVSSLKAIIKSKEEMIQQLKEGQSVGSNNQLTELLAEATRKIEDMTAQISMHHTGEMPDSDRPKMETVFVDPIEKESKVEKHFDIEDISTKEKAQMEDKVNKLKNLMGNKLPGKKD